MYSCAGGDGGGGGRLADGDGLGDDIADAGLAGGGERSLSDLVGGSGCQGLDNGGGSSGLGGRSLLSDGRRGLSCGVLLGQRVAGQLRGATEEIAELGALLLSRRLLSSGSGLSCGLLGSGLGGLLLVLDLAIGDDLGVGDAVSSSGGGRLLGRSGSSSLLLLLGGANAEERTATLGAGGGNSRSRSSLGGLLLLGFLGGGNASGTGSDGGNRGSSLGRGSDGRALLGGSDKGLLLGCGLGSSSGSLSLGLLSGRALLEETAKDALALGSSALGGALGGRSGLGLLLSLDRVVGKSLDGGRGLSDGWDVVVSLDGVAGKGVSGSGLFLLGFLLLGLLLLLLLA